MAVLLVFFAKNKGNYIKANSQAQVLACHTFTGCQVRPNAKCRGLWESTHKYHSLKRVALGGRLHLHKVSTQIIILRNLAFNVCKFYVLGILHHEILNQS